MIFAVFHTENRYAHQRIPSQVKSFCLIFSLIGCDCILSQVLLYMFKASLERLFETYAVLRTRFYSGWNDTPLQIVYKTQTPQIHFADIFSLIGCDCILSQVLLYIMQICKMNLRCLRFIDKLKIDWFKASLERLFETYAVLRTRFYSGWNDTPLRIPSQVKSFCLIFSLIGCDCILSQVLLYIMQICKYSFTNCL
jgi:hypothetical protein